LDRIAERGSRQLPVGLSAYQCGPLLYPLNLDESRQSTQDRTKVKLIGRLWPIAIEIKSQEVI
jgi:hypothetical protein